MTVANPSPSSALVIGMGLGTVFVGLICIILICYLMGWVIRLLEKKKPAAKAAAPLPQPEPEAAEPIEDRGELIAVISAVIAEQLGESTEAIRIRSIRKVS